jgi:hypothetical protein
VASIYDPDGQRIAEATLELPTNGTTAQLHHVKKGADLLNFYFGKGQRWVLVDTPDGQVRGRLHTRWEGMRRAWEITLQMPSMTRAAVPMLPMMAEDEAEAARP